MRYKGNPLEKRTLKVTLPRRDGETPIEVVVCAIKLGWEVEFDSMYPAPAVRSRTIMRKGSDPIREAEPADEKEVLLRSNARTAYRIYLALKQDENIEFENKPIDKDSLQKLAKEISEDGFEAGDYGIILNAAVLAANLDDKSQDEALKDFV